MCAENVQINVNDLGVANFYSLLKPYFAINLVIFMKHFDVSQE